MAPLLTAIPLFFLCFFVSNVSSQSTMASGSSTFASSITSVSDSPSASSTANGFDTLMAIGYSILTSEFVDDSTTYETTMTSMMSSKSAASASTTPVSSVSSAAATPLPTSATESSPAATSAASSPSKDSGDSHRNLGIILGTILGFTAIAIGLTLFCFRRRRRRPRGYKRGIFTQRSATPLDDAEFARWRQPVGSTVTTVISAPSSAHTRTPEKSSAFSSRRVSTRSQRHFSGGIVQVENPFDTPRYQYRPRATSHSTLDYEHEKTPQTTVTSNPVGRTRNGSIESQSDRPSTPPYSPNRARDNSGSTLLSSPRDPSRHTLDDDG